MFHTKPGETESRFSFQFHVKAIGTRMQYDINRFFGSTQEPNDHLKLMEALRLTE